MKLFQNPTRQFLLGFATVFFLGALANSYFVFKPSHYSPSAFNPRSAVDWIVFLVNSAFIVYFYLILKNVRSPYARTYWLALLGIFSAGYGEKYFLRLSAEASQIFSTIGCLAISAISILFFQLYRRRPFSLFDGLTYRLKKTIRTRLKKP